MLRFLVSCLLASLPLLACGVSPKHTSVHGQGLAAFVDASGTISTHDVQKVSRSHGSSNSSGSRRTLAAARRNVMRAEFAETPAALPQVQDLPNGSLSQAAVNASSNISLTEDLDKAAVNTSSNMSFTEDLDQAVGLQMKSMYSAALCVDKHGSNNNVYMHSCHNGNNQKWWFDGWTIKVKNGQCLDYHSSGNIGMAPCLNTLNQAWYWSGKNIKSKDSNTTCMEYGTENRRRGARRRVEATLTMSPCKQDNRQEWYFLTEATNHVKSVKTATCLEGKDTSHRRRRLLVLKPCYNGKEQQFFFDGDHLKEKRHPNKCFTNALDLKECNSDKNQRWKLDGQRLLSIKSNNCLQQGHRRRSNNLDVSSCANEDTKFNWLWGEVVVDIGKSKNAKKRCVQKSGMTCSSDAGNKGIRVNSDHKNAGDIFIISTTATEVCATRQDGNHNSWGMKLKIMCIQATTTSTTKALPPLPTAHSPAPSPLSFIPRSKGVAALWKTRQSNECIDYSTNRRRGTVYLHKCHNGNNQQWYVNGEAIKIKKNDKKCLSLSGSRVTIANCNDKSEQKWHFDGESLKTYQGTYKTKCADFDYSSGDNHLGMQPCTGRYNQRFYFVKVSATPKEVMTREGKNMCLDTHGGTKAVYMHLCHTGNTQKFYEDGDQIQSPSTPNKCLTHVLDTTMEMKDCNSALNQKWFFSGEGLKVKDSNNCLSWEFRAGDLKNGDAMLKPCNGQDKYQQWFFKTITTTTTTTYVSPTRVFAFKLDGSQAGCLDEDAHRKLVVHSPCHNGGNQKWYTASIPGHAGYFFIKNQKKESSGLCLENDIKMKTCDVNKKSQRWQNKGKTYLDAWGYCLDKKGNNNKAVFTHKCNSGANQNFQFEKAPYCAWNSWGEWSVCSAACAGGVKVKRRSKKSESPTGYVPCTEQRGLGLEEENCNMTRCGTPCEWANWGEWSKCSQTCGGKGKHTRTRKVAKEAKFGGAPCHGDKNETEHCNKNPCPVDCKLADWKGIAWGACSTTCGTGKSVRTRGVLISAKHGGKACKNEDMKQEVTCNAAVPCPVDCVYGEWGSWSICTKSCGNGTQHATREVKTNASNGGQDCPGGPTKSQPCNQKPCAIDCKWGEWEEWPACSKSCTGVDGVSGSRERSRNKTVKENAYGKPCKESGKMSEHCNLQGCPVNCEWNSWESWSKCSKTCGEGRKNRTRKKAVEKANNGADCVGNATDSDKCNPDPCPANCEWTEWGEWSNCSKSCGGGHQVKKRQVKQHAVGTGTACGGNNTEDKKCNEQGCPQDCKWGDWDKWSNCSKPCGKGKQIRERKVLHASMHGGTACLGNETDSQDCNDVDCPRDCTMGEWGAWSPCSSTCKGGMHNRSRNFTPAVGSGTPCAESEKKSEDEPCNTDVECPEDCKLMPWDNWIACSVTCGEGVRKRSRAIVEAKNQGKPCDGKTEGTEICFGAQVDCNDSSVTLAPTLPPEAGSENGSESNTTAASTPEVQKGSYVTGDMQLQTTSVSELMKNDLAKDAVKDSIADLSNNSGYTCTKEQIEVKFEQASGSLMEARDMNPTDSGIIDVTFSIKLNASSGDVASQGAKLASDLATETLTVATFSVDKMMKRDKVKCGGNDCAPEVIGLTARVTDEGLTGEEVKQKRGVWPEKVPEHAAKAAASTTTVHSASCRPSETWRLVWTAAVLVAAVVASHRC